MEQVLGALPIRQTRQGTCTLLTRRTIEFVESLLTASSAPWRETERKATPETRSCNSGPTAISLHYCQRTTASSDCHYVQRGCAGINRHVVGDARALQERRVANPS